MFVNGKLDVSGYKRIIFQDGRLHWSNSFLLAHPKRIWQNGIHVLWRVCEQLYCLSQRSVPCKFFETVLKFSTLVSSRFYQTWKLTRETKREVRWMRAFLFKNLIQSHFVHTTSCLHRNQYTHPELSLFTHNFELVTSGHSYIFSPCRKSTHCWLVCK